ncbi:hypothetical protein [Methylobacterium nodulans]|uniref:Methyltransferase n=1 Tax=Methylobacterium nodulans (strain LMG 21967 / CNCM I-2342 / ORS 2060) TaxID=460265 RepID=B8IA60_METNO|nr:hypothetical protein [Methylobacterium nodulans]ACL59123.1 conserved hypothetical protein [Methylobacterium nodulans ORS 2060]
MSVIAPAGGAAVMASRREPPDSLDFFPTAPWGTRAFVRHVLPRLSLRPIASVWDPCCGAGHMAEVLRESIPNVHASDVFDYGCGYVVADFLDAATLPPRDVEAIVFNPPFNVAADFVLRALDLAPIVACLCRTAWNEGADRYKRLFRRRPPTLFAPYVERLPMHRGRWEPNGTTATAYAWFCWSTFVEPQPILHIPPGCRRALTRPDDAARFGAQTTAPLLVAAE